MRETNVRWLLDWYSPTEYKAHAIRRELLNTSSDYQQIDVVEIADYGRCLLLDGDLQSCELDEHIYHEFLVHPAMLMHSEPRSVLIIGGGEGATLREVLKHSSVDQVTMVELDVEVVNAAKSHLPTYHAGAFEDPRVRLVIADGRAFLDQSPERYDVIILDLSDPSEHGPALRLFTAEFYHLVREHLSGDGIVSLQSESASLTGADSLARIHQTVTTVFPSVYTAAVFIPSYTLDWSFTTAANQLSPPDRLSVQEIDDRVAARITQPLRSYDGIGHCRAFHLPRHLRALLSHSHRSATGGHDHLA